MNTPQPLQKQQTGLGEPPAGAAGGVILYGVIGLVAAGAGAYGGYLLGKSVSSKKYRTAGEIIGAVAGFVIVPAAIGAVASVFGRQPGTAA